MEGCLFGSGCFFSSRSPFGFGAIASRALFGYGVLQLEGAFWFSGLWALFGLGSRVLETREATRASPN